MNNNCLHCGTPFKARRTTKKYCGHNCKQLAYFKRNGMVFGLSGTPRPENFKSLALTQNDNDTQNSFSKKNEIENHSQVSPEISTQNNSEKIKDGILFKEKENPQPMMSEKQLENLIYRISTNLENKLELKMQVAIDTIKKDFEIKYESATLLYNTDKPLTTEMEILSCHKEPFMDSTKKGLMLLPNQENVKEQEEKISVEPEVNPIETILTSDTHDTDNTDHTHHTANTIEKSKEHYTEGGKKNTLPETLPATLPYIELCDDENDNDDETNEDDGDEREDKITNGLYDINQTEELRSDTEQENKDKSKTDNREEYIKELETKIEFLMGQLENSNSVNVEKNTANPQTELLTDTNGNKENIENLNSTAIPEQKIHNPETEQKYEWVHSKFYQDIEYFNERTAEEHDFSGSNEDVNWVNVRLRCVIENVIRLNEVAFIDRESVLRLTNTLSGIINSASFNHLPASYPYSETILDLSESLNGLSSKYKNENVPLRISFKLKAKLVSMQNQLRDIVNLIRFDEIHFTEPHRGIFNDALSRSKNQKHVENNNKKKNSWKQRHKQYVEAGLIDNDDDDDNEEEDEDSQKKYSSRENPYEDRFRHFERTGKFPSW